MEKYQLQAKKRTILGRKVKNLRKKGILPANIYGNKIKSQPIELNLIDFKKTFRKAGETKIVHLSLEDQKIHPVLIHNVQIDHLTGNPLHVDFYEVNLKEKVKTKVPIHLVGTAPAVAQKIGLLIQTLNEVEIEALPTALPEKIELDITPLTALDQELKVSDLKLPQEVTLLTDPSLAVVKVGKLISKEAEELAKEEATAQAAAQTPPASTSEEQAGVSEKTAAEVSTPKPSAPTTTQTQTAKK